MNEKKMTVRPSRINNNMEIAEVISKRSTCKRAKVGCVLTYNNRIISTGYNGSAPGTEQCIDKECLKINNHCILTIHAEQNAIANMTINPGHGITAYTTHSPCGNCYKALASIGVKEIFYSRHYNDDITDKLSEVKGWPKLIFLGEI